MMQEKLIETISSKFKDRWSVYKFLNIVLKIGILCPMGALIAGCSLDANITSLDTVKVLSKSPGSEVVPASNQNSYTTRGRLVQSSVSYQSGASEVLTNRGYKAHTSIQGTIFKDWRGN